MTKSLNDIKWKEFTIKDIVILEKNKNRYQVPTGSNISKSLLIEGQNPRVTVTSLNNGVDGFYDAVKLTREYENFISVSFLGNAFYHPYKATTDMKVHTFQLKTRKLNRYVALFIITTLQSNTKNTSYGNQLSSTDLPLKKILLPITSEGEPDYEFMEEYIKERESKLKQQYKKYVTKRLEELKIKIDVEKTWQDFELSKIFEIKSGKRLTKADMKQGNIPFIGSTDSNNGVTNFCSDVNTSTDRDVLGVNYNGSVVETFYHPYKCTFSDDVKRLNTKNISGNKYIYLFIKNSIIQQKVKYMYGYKFNENRMKRQKIMLPVNEASKPDYEYMENYMKYLEQKKLLEYLRYIK